MLGAFLGDIVGSPFEFDRGRKVKDFHMFGHGCTITDDSVMTAAVCEALLAAGTEAEISEIERRLAVSNTCAYPQGCKSYSECNPQSSGRPEGSGGNGQCDFSCQNRCFQGGNLQIY